MILNQNFDEDNGSDTTESETTTQDDGKATDQLTLDEVSSVEVVQDDYQDNDESSEVTEDLLEFPEEMSDDQIGDYPSANNEVDQFDFQSKSDDGLIEHSEENINSLDVTQNEHNDLSDYSADLDSEVLQITSEEEVSDAVESRTSFTDSFGDEEDDLTEQILYLDSLVSEMEFVDEEISDSEVNDRISDEVYIETVKERKERLERSITENVDESVEDESSAQPEQQDTSIKYPEKKRPDDPYLSIIVSSDQLEAFLVLYPHEEEYHSAGDIKTELERAGVVFGIEHRRIAELLDQVNNDRKAALGEVIAKGQPAIAGKDAEILYEFSLEQPELVIIEDEFGRVDYKDVYQIDSVQEGDLVATLVPSEPPEDGTSVLGTPIVGKTGMETRVMNGKNCFFDEGDLRFYAEITGQPLLKNNKIAIVPIFTVAGDVDLSVGNVNFLGSIVVNGNINAGFSITASEDIRVLGNVEGAFLKAGGEIAIKKGFIGGDKGQISAARRITVKHCANGTMKCDGDILVEQYVLNSDVSCKGKLKSMTGKGCIIGGLNRAVKGIECLNLGSELGVHTNAIAGDNYLVADMLKKINRYLKLFHERMNKIRERHRHIHSKTK